MTEAYRAGFGRISELGREERYRCRLSPQLIESAAAWPPPRRKQFLAGRVLLAETLATCFPVRRLPFEISTASGKPGFAEPHLPHFSISHSGDHVAVLLGMTNPVGCDLEIERERKNAMALARDFFSEDEFIHLERQPDETRLHAFWKLWTAREAVLKQQEKSVWALSEFSVQPETLKLVPPQALHIHHMMIDDAHFSVCGTAPVKQTILSHSPDWILCRFCR